MQKIDVEARACVEREKSGKFLGGFFAPRKKFEAYCEQEARQKYQQDLSEVEAEERSKDEIKNDAFKNALTDDNKEIYIILAGIFLFLIIALLIIF